MFRELIQEQGLLAGDPGTPYHYRYAYDQLGNRTRETDLAMDRYTLYEYDTDYADPNALAYPTKNNRLLSYRVYGQCLLPPFHQLERTVRYSYYQNGDVAHITVFDVGGDKSHDLYLNYSTTGTLWLAFWQEWPGEAYPEHFAPGDPNDPNDPDFGKAVTDAWEFRYDTGRQRYLTRHLNFDHTHLDMFWPVGEDRWTDYLGEQPYVDYAVTGWEPVTPQTRYLAGLGIHGLESVTDPNDPYSTDFPRRYFHGDLIDSTMLLTDESGQVADPGGLELHGVRRYRGPGRDPGAEYRRAVRLRRRVRSRNRAADAGRHERGLPADHAAARGRALVPAGDRPLRAAGSDWDLGRVEHVPVLRCTAVG